jgi:hypothetical protein
LVLASSIGAISAAQQRGSLRSGRGGLRLSPQPAIPPLTGLTALGVLGPLDGPEDALGGAQTLRRGRQVKTLATRPDRACEARRVGALVPAGAPLASFCHCWPMRRPSKFEEALARAYVIEKMTNALNILATGSGDVRERVADALVACHTLRERDFPDGRLRDDWRWIFHEATKLGPDEDSSGRIWAGSAHSTMRNRRKSTGRKIAQRFWSLYWAIKDTPPYD